MSLYQVGTLASLGPVGRPLGSRSAAQHWLRQSCFSGSTPLRPGGPRALVLGLARQGWRLGSAVKSPRRARSVSRFARGPRRAAVRRRLSAYGLASAVVLGPGGPRFLRPVRGSLAPSRASKAPRFVGRPPARPGSVSGPSPAWWGVGCGASSPPSPPRLLCSAVRSALRGLAASPRPPLWSGVPAPSALGATGSGWGGRGLPARALPFSGRVPRSVLPGPRPRRTILGCVYRLTWCPFYGTLVMRYSSTRLPPVAAGGCCCLLSCHIIGLDGPAVNPRC